MKKKKRRVYTKEFKEEAVRLTETSGKSTAAIARDLGIRADLLRKWKADLQEAPHNAFPGRGNMKLHDKEMRDLKRKLKIAEEERDILKKALAIFSEKPGKNTDS